MRLDKYLKVSRLVKRRTVAKDLCQAGKVSVNARPAKAGADVNPGDIISINRGGRVTEVEVLETSENVSASDAENMYRLRNETRDVGSET